MLIAIIVVLALLLVVVGLRLVSQRLAHHQKLVPGLRSFTQVRRINQR